MKLNKQKIRKVILVLGFAFYGTGVAGAGDTLADYFSSHDEASTFSVDHRPWAHLLDLYLDDEHSSGIHRFNYSAVSRAHMDELAGYLKYLEALNPDTMNRDEQMAYWINFYNALTVQVVLDAYPVESIRDIRLPGSRRGPWKAPLVSVNGKMLSLDDIEHEILRPIWADPRIHFAVNCASLGCPNLAATPFTGSNLEVLLESGTREYINQPRGVSLDGRRLLLSSIFNWYSGDFGGRDGLISFLLRYADADTSLLIGNAGSGYRYAYDWNLNEPD